MPVDDEIPNAGFAHPPKRTQFKKGVSGNPRGRPKKTPSFTQDLAAELKETLVLSENGKERRVSKQRALVKTLVAAAIKKDIKAVTVLLSCMRHFGVGLEEESETSMSPEDQEILRNFVKRQD